MSTITRFDELIHEALAQELVGWDFAWLDERTKDAQLPWDYHQVVRERMQGIGALLDLGTGGGEFLASLAPLPQLTWATEGYPPNIQVACRRLAPLGAQLADVSQAGKRLPFTDATFDLVINRHSGEDACEVYRVLKTGGRYVSQQVGGENCLGLNRVLQDDPFYRYAASSLTRKVGYLETAGFRVVDQQEAFPNLAFLDIGGVVFYLKAISWQIEDFSVEKYRSRLFQMHQLIEAQGSFVVKQHRYFVEAVK